MGSAGGVRAPSERLQLLTIALTDTQEDDLGWVMTLEADPEVARWITVWPADRHRLAISAPDEAHLTVNFAGEHVGFVLLAGLDSPHRSGTRYLPLCLMSILEPEWRRRRGPSS
jgi:hypothetical protein